jgi:hypothetical protein
LVYTFAHSISAALSEPHRSQLCEKYSSLVMASSLCLIKLPRRAEFAASAALNYEAKFIIC